MLKLTLKAEASAGRQCTRLWRHKLDLHCLEVGGVLQLAGVLVCKPYFKAKVPDR